MEVKIYWNIRKKCWSLQLKGKVICHANSVLLKSVIFIVSEKGRKRVLKEQTKNVHAFAKGILVEKNLSRPEGLNLQISYNPYKFDYFFDTKSMSKVTKSKLVFCEAGKIYCGEYE